MIRRFVILRRKPGISIEEFREHWQNVHGELVKKVPGIIKYIQYHVYSEKPDGVDDQIDGIAELWFESKEAQLKAYASPEYQAVLEDAKTILGDNTHYVHPVIAENIIELI